MPNESRESLSRLGRIATIGLAVVVSLAIGFAGGRLTAPSADKRNPSDGVGGIPPKRTYADPKIAPGDILGIYFDGMLGVKGQQPLVYEPKAPGDNYAIGYPFTVDQNGDIFLPYVEPFHVAGLTPREAMKLILGRYVERNIMKAGFEEMYVSIIRPYDSGN